MALAKEVGYDNTMKVFTAVNERASLQGLVGNRVI